MRLKIVGIAINLLSYIPLLLPIYKTKIDGAAEYDMIIRGFNFAEFSLWGNLILSIPIVVLAIAFCKIKNRWKNIILISVYVFSVVVLYYASIAADTWIRNIATGFVFCRPCQIIYLLSLLVSMGCLFVHFNRHPDSDE